MPYLSKTTIIQSYTTLSCIDNDKQQGLTQKVSALKYLSAFDLFRKEYNDNCDLKNSENKKRFSSYVGEIIRINETYCTKDFYNSISENGRDYDCGSNFYSQSSVKDSKTNPSKTFQYPKRKGWKPVLDVVNQKLIYKEEYLKEAIEFYLPEKSLRISFILWLLRFQKITGKTVSNIRTALLSRHTETFCNAIIADNLESDDFNFIELSDAVCTLNKEDFIDDKYLILQPHKLPIPDLPHQQIFYGAPGTGKSHGVEWAVKRHGMTAIRTTFHPDSDYSTFVGAYKPQMEAVVLRDYRGEPVQKDGSEVSEKRIVYKFTQQAFLKAYIAAWKNLRRPHVLVIEEINRGNCAQIFGDLFQLLDRDEAGFSKYPIEADTDIKEALEEAFKGLQKTDIAVLHGDTTADDITSGQRLVLPNNLYIWATMNTSDQSLFPIDSAFKRRWEWKYVPISDAGMGWRIAADDAEYDWWSFVERINDKIWDATQSEDKKLGYFFCKADRKRHGGDTENTIISANRFVGKVLFYLYNDVFKNYCFDDDTFQDLPFQSYFKPDGSPQEETVAAFLKRLGVAEIRPADNNGGNKTAED